MGHRSEETKLSKSPPSIAPVSRAFARIDQDAPAAWQQAATSAGEQQRNSSAVAPPAAAPPAAAPPPAAVALPLLSIHSVFRDRFVRVNARGGLRADAEFPWSDESWFRALPQLCAQERVPALSGQAKENEVAAAAGGDDDDPAAELERRLSRTWFALQSERVGKLLSLHDGRDKPGRGGGGSGAPSRAFVPLAELSPPSRRRRAPHAAHRPEEPRAPPSACWRLEEGGLRNRGSRGWLNVRPSGATTCIGRMGMRMRVRAWASTRGHMGMSMGMSMGMGVCTCLVHRSALTLCRPPLAPHTLQATCVDTATKARHGAPRTSRCPRPSSCC